MTNAYGVMEKRARILKKTTTVNAAAQYTAASADRRCSNEPKDLTGADRLPEIVHRKGFVACMKNSLQMAGKTTATSGAGAVSAGRAINGSLGAPRDIPSDHKGGHGRIAKHPH